MSAPAVLHIGLDIGWRRDTSGVIAVSWMHDIKKLRVFCHRSWEPSRDTGEVLIPRVTAYVMELLSTQRVAGIWYDHHQWASESQRVSEAGYGRLLNDVPQSGNLMIEAGANLSALLERGDLLIPSDVGLLNQFSWCAAKMTERGPRIIKQIQTKPIDLVVALAMACFGAMHDSVAVATVPDYEAAGNLVSLEDLGG